MPEPLTKTSAIADVSGVTDMSGMFQYAAKFNQNIGNWDVSDVTRMLSMFRGATTFNQNIGNWEVVFGMLSMFQDIKALAPYRESLGCQ